MTKTYTTPVAGADYEQGPEAVERHLRLSNNADLKSKDCKARSNGFACCLDAHHVELGTRHMHRTVDPETNKPVVISFKMQEST
jgi:hypothetical protein